MRRTGAGSRFAQAGRLLVTLALVGLLVHLVDLERVGALLGAADLRFVLGAFVVAGLDRVLMILKWYPLLLVQGAGVGLGTAARAYLASGLAHYVLPASVGADAVRAVVLGRGRKRVVEVGASIAAERVLGLIGSAVMSLVAVLIALHDGIPLVAVGLWAGCAIGLGGAALLVPLSPTGRRLFDLAMRRSPAGRWSAVLQRFGLAYSLYGRRPRTLMWVGGLSVLEQLFPVALTYFVALALGVPVTFGACVVAVTLTLFAMRLPISMGGLGIGEGALVYLLGLYGIAASGALAVAVGVRVLEVLVNAGPGVVLWRDLLAARRGGK